MRRKALPLERVNPRHARPDNQRVASVWAVNLKVTKVSLHHQNLQATMEW